MRETLDSIVFSKTLNDASNMHCMPRVRPVATLRHTEARASVFFGKVWEKGRKRNLKKIKIKKFESKQS